MSDNYKKYPPRMSDGRFMTEFRPNCLVNKNIMDTMNMDSYEYRMYLTKSAESIMKQINDHNNELYGCKDCSNVTVPPVKNMQNCWGPNCQIEMVNPTGIGIDQVVKPQQPRPQPQPQPQPQPSHQLP